MRSSRARPIETGPTTGEVPRQPNGSTPNGSASPFGRADAETLLDTLYGEDAGYACLAVAYGPHWTAEGRYEHDGPPVHTYYRWPAERELMLTEVGRVLACGEPADVYYCPALQHTARRRQGEAIGPRVLWADLDAEPADPVLLSTLEPVRVASGTPGHRQVYVPLAEQVDLATWGRLQRGLRDRLSADHKIADNDLLRLPGTRNHKSDPPRPVDLMPSGPGGRVWAPEALADLLGVDLGATEATPRAESPPGAGPAPEPLPSGVREALAHPEISDRSAAHHRVVAACFDSGLTLGQTITIVSGYGPSIAKYGARLITETARSWEAIAENRRNGAYVVPPQATPPVAETVVTDLADLYVPVDWHRVWAETPEGADWLVPGLLERGRSHAEFSAAKAGKSLLTLDVVAALAAHRPLLGQANPHPGPLRVLYIDAENALADLRERLAEMGYGPDDLAELTYLSFPSLPGLDSAVGGAHLLALAQRHRPDLLVLDTVARVVEGEENSSDTFRALYRHALAPLKAMGITVLRLDHTGKDPTAGQRGSSAKSDDVDTVWHLTAHGEGRLRLRCERQRTGHHPEVIELHRHARTEQNPLWHERLDTGSDRPEVAHVIRELGRLDVPADAGRNVCRTALAEAGIGIRNDVLAEAIRARKLRVQPWPRPVPKIGDRSDDEDRNRTCPQDQQTHTVVAGQACPGQVGDRWDRLTAVPTHAPVPDPVPLDGDRSGRTGRTCPGPEPSPSAVLSLLRRQHRPTPAPSPRGKLCERCDRPADRLVWGRCRHCAYPAGGDPAADDDHDWRTE